ncbi:hypothetical protein [Ralstonia solanacearum]|uniref:hypothetical protein n=1 Tax=Ralstonia solanacearum TaxID=305 RepID=UPI0018D1A998|nr:hypothetical protein [Ralstonia solanacearum]
MQNYSQRVRESILPLSVGETLPNAFEEWSVTDRIIDHGAPNETCQLCGKDELRYHFEILNVFTGGKLWVGSHCILKFGLSVFENGQALSPAAAKKKIHRLMEQVRQQSCIRALEALAASESNDILYNALRYFRTHKFLSPKHASVVLWQLEKHQIDHNPSFFKINLKHARFKEQLEGMEGWRIRLLWPALTSSQREVARRYGHIPPAL